MAMHFWLLGVSLLCMTTLVQLDDFGLLDRVPKQYLEDNELASKINEFGYQLAKQMMKSSGNMQNVLISPASVSGLLAMTMLGGVGETHDEIAQVLGFSKDVKRNRKSHDKFGTLLQELNSEDTSSKTLYADVIFVDAAAKLRDAYRMYLQRVYSGNAINLNFLHPGVTKDTINGWVSNHTEGKISNFLTDPLPADTQVVLLSALYFSGQWKKPFIIDHTQQLPFNGPTKTVTVDQMLNLGYFPYVSSSSDDFHMVALPYNDSMTTMYALKPRRPWKLSLPELLDKLDYAKIDSFINKMVTQECVIRYPKMDLQKSENLKENLVALGVKTLFSPRYANFALMIDSNTGANKREDELISRLNSDDEESKSLKDIVNSLPNPGVHVDTVLHDVKLKIDEYGTEAVAATGGILARTAQQFYADSPFLLFIRNEKTKLVTFTAIIFDPTI